MSRSRKSDSKAHKDEHHLSILEAVENLSNIAEMELDDKIGFIEDHVVVHGTTDEEVLETIQWLEDKSEHQTEQVVEETYRAVLKYLKEFHQKEFNRFYDQKNQEGIRKIMLLVGQASDKLKNFTHLFKGVHQKGIEETKEYKQLEKFYKERIAIEDNEKVSLIDLSRKERELDLQKHPQIEEDENTVNAKKFLLDVERSKHDDHYELLGIQRDDGSRFLEPQFFRNIKVACNFGEFVGPKAERNPFEGLEHWQDLSLHKSAIKILKLIKPHLKVFFQDALKYKDMEIVSNVNMAVMALMLAANPKNRANLGIEKSCKGYFKDYQHYLRQTIESFEYQKLRAAPPPSSKVFLVTMVDIIHLLSWGLFFHGVDYQSLAFVLDDIIEEGRVSVRRKGHKDVNSKEFWHTLEQDYLHVQRYLMSYPVGPLFKTLKCLQEGGHEGYDPLMHGSIPCEFQNICLGNKCCSILKLPSPTTQELIFKASLAPEFVGLLDAYHHSKEDKKHLFVNLQDRTDWSEVARAHLLEKLPNQSEYVGEVDTITLNKNSDFYHQSGAYEPISKAKDFFKQLVFNLHAKEAGFFFSPWVEKHLFGGFLEKLIKSVHKFFFEGKTELTVKERQNFIEITYQMLILKVMEVTKSNSMSFSCKDAIDIGGAQNTTFYGFMRLVAEQKLSERDRQKMQWLLFAEPMLSRDRVIQSGRFLRMVQCLKWVQKILEKRSSGQFYQEFEKYYELDLSEIRFEKSVFEQIGSEKSK